MSKPILSAAVPPNVMERVEKYAEEKGISKSEAASRLIEKSLDIEEAEGVHLVSTDGGKTQQQLDAINNRLNEIQASESLNETKSVADELVTLPLVLSILWIGIEVAFGFPFKPFLAIATGVPLVLWLLYPQLREMYD